MNEGYTGPIGLVVSAIFEKISKSAKKTVEKLKFTSANPHQSTNEPDSRTAEKERIKNIAKVFFISEKKVKEASKSGRLNELEEHLKKEKNTYEKSFSNYEKGRRSFNPESKITAHQLMKTTTKAFLTLKKPGEATYVNQGFFKGKLLAVKQENGEILISKKIKHLGKGTFGKVQSQQVLNREVNVKTIGAVKFARTNDRVADRAKEDVQKEFKNINNIHSKFNENHPNETIVGIQDKPHTMIHIREVNAVGFLGAKYDGDGETLIGTLKDTNSVKNVALQMFEGLHTMQEQGFHHGDIKPGNLLVRTQQDGNVTVHHADFGGGRFFNDITASGEGKRKVLNFSTHTPLYTHPKDALNIRALHKEMIDGGAAEKDKESGAIRLKDPKDLNDTQKQLITNNEAKIAKILKSADTYATAMSLYEMITGLTYDHEAVAHEGEYAENIVGLAASGLSYRGYGPFYPEALEGLVPQEFILSMQNALQDSYEKRPDPAELIKNLTI